MGILGWIVFGLIVGAIAKLLMPGRDPGGIIVTMVLGIVGALLGGFVGRALGMYGANESAGFIMALIGAVFVLLIYRLSIGGPSPDGVVTTRSGTASAPSRHPATARPTALSSFSDVNGFARNCLTWRPIDFAVASLS